MRTCHVPCSKHGSHKLGYLKGGNVKEEWEKIRERSMGVKETERRASLEEEREIER